MSTIRVSIITSLYRGEKYLKSFLHHLASINNPEECELVLIHNDPTDEEFRLIDCFKNPGIQIQHKVVEREPLYNSWNRGVVASNGEYLTIWNVDDVRCPNSISFQVAALDKNPKAALAYGNYVTVNIYGSKSGITANPPDFEENKKLFFRKHQIGSFPMWRKDIHSSIGFFDEQFKLVADLDFQIRVAKKHSLTKVNECLGYYLEGTPDNLSSNYKLQDYEQTALHLRYGNLDLIYLTYFYSVLKEFKINQYNWLGNYHPVTKWYKHDKRNAFKSIYLITTPILKLPKHIARKYIRQIARKYLKYHLLRTGPNF